MLYRDNVILWYTRPAPIPFFDFCESEALGLARFKCPFTTSARFQLIRHWRRRPRNGRLLSTWILAQLYWDLNRRLGSCAAGSPENERKCCEWIFPEHGSDDSKRMNLKSLPWAIWWPQVMEVRTIASYFNRAKLLNNRILWHSGFELVTRVIQKPLWSFAHLGICGLMIPSGWISLHYSASISPLWIIDRYGGEHHLASWYSNIDPHGSPHFERQYVGSV
jgi:hypothetical protein